MHKCFFKPLLILSQPLSWGQRKLHGQGQGLKGQNRYRAKGVDLRSPFSGSICYSRSNVTCTKNTSFKSYLLLQHRKGRSQSKKFYIRRVLGRKEKERKLTFLLPVDSSEKKAETGKAGSLELRRMLRVKGLCPTSHFGFHCGG